MAWGDLSPENEQLIKGARGSLLVEELTLSTTWQEITTGKTTRNGLNIQNRSSGEDSGLVNIYIRHSGTGTAGMAIYPSGERQYTISNLAVYVKAASGTPTVTIEALS